MHCIKKQGLGGALRGTKVTVRRYLDGRMDVWVFKGRVLPHTTARWLPRVSAIVDGKTVDAHVDAIVERSHQNRTPEPVG